MKKKEFYSETLKFVEIQECDLKCIMEWRNADDTRSQFIYDKKLTYDDQINWFMKYSESSNDLMFMIYFKDNIEPFAVAALYNIKQESAEFGRLMIGRDGFKGKGFGRQIVLELTRYAFNVLNCKRVYLEVFNDNLKALKSYEKVGFRMTGESKEVNGRLLVKMELLK